MIIQHARVTLLKLPYVEQPAFQLGYDRDREILLLELETDDGRVGLGYQLFLQPGFRTVKACLEEMMLPRVMSRDATGVEGIWADRWRSHHGDGRGGAALFAQSAIDVALWDLIGQAAGMPLHRLRGHVRSEVPLYGSGCWRGLGGDGMVEKAVRLVEAGFRAVKMQVGHARDRRTDIDNVRRVREAVGPEVDVMVDANMAWTADEAILMGRRLAEYDIDWLEEPVAVTDYAGYFRIADALDVRAVGGESHFTRFEMRPFFEHPKLPILQPDVVRGGLPDLRKVAALADTCGMTVAPHLYPERMVHVLASIPNGLILEDMGLLDDLWVTPLEVKGGVARAPEVPGHGLRVKPEMVRAGAVT